MCQTFYGKGSKSSREAEPLAWSLTPAFSLGQPLFCCCPHILSTQCTDTAQTGNNTLYLHPDPLSLVPHPSHLLGIVRHLFGCAEEEDPGSLGKQDFLIGLLNAACDFIPVGR